MVSQITSARATPLLMAAWALIVLGIVYLTVAGGGGFLGNYITYYRIASVAIVVLALGVWLALARTTEFWRPRTMLWPAMAACLVALAIGIVRSDQPRLGYDFVAYALLLTGAYLLLQRLFAHAFFGPRLGWLAVLLGFGISAVYILGIAYRWIIWWSDLGRITTPPLRPDFQALAYGNPGAVAIVVILLWLAALAHLGLSTTASRRTVVSLGVLTAMTVFLTGSRAAWVALGASAVIVLPLWIPSGDQRRRISALLKQRSARWLALASATTVLLLALLFAPAVASRLAEPSADTRIAFLSASLRMIVAHPITGVGPGMWVVDRIRHTEPPEADVYIPHAHNIVAQTLAELGLVGALAGAIVSLVMVRLIVRGIRSSDALTRRLAWTGLFGGIYLLAHQMFDLYVNMPAIGFCYALTIARLDALVPSDRPPDPRIRSPAPVLAALAVGFAISGTWLAHSEDAALKGDAAVASAEAGDWTAAAASAAAAVALDRAMPPYRFVLGVAEAHNGMTAAALEHIRQSAEIDHFPIAWLNVARLELGLGHHEAAREAVARAMRLGYQQPLVALGASMIDLELGDDPAATDAIAAALIAAPSLASDPYWDDPARRTVFLQAVTVALREASPGTGYKVALEAGRPDKALAIVAALPEEERAVPKDVVQAWTGDRAAFEELHALAMADPLDAETVAMCRLVAARSLDRDWAGTTTFTCDRAGAPAVPTIVRVSPPSRSPVSLPGPDASVHFQYVYRRSVPWDVLVPGLPHLVAVAP